MCLPFVSVCERVHACLRWCLFFFVRECQYVCACMRAFVCVSLTAYVIVYVFVFVRVCSESVCVYIRVCPGACVFSWVSVCTCVLVCVSLYV